MSIRVPDGGIEMPSLNDIEPVLKWYTLNCELVTPMYGGGVKSVVIDEQMPIRASSIRGQLRFWWRLLAKHKWQLGDDKAIQKQEFALWGGMGASDDDGVASQVFLRVTDVPSSNKIRQSLIDYDDTSLSKLKYVLFPAYNETDPALDPHKLLKAEDINWKLNFAFSPALINDTTRQNQIVETLRWWACFGGLGFRSRKGLGSVRVTECTDFPIIAQPLSSEDVQQARCQLVQRNPNKNPIEALQSAINKLSDFRQKVGLARSGTDKSPGRSRWPEPDALRRIYPASKHDKNHAPVHDAGEVFPRALFGLPINFHFPKERALNTMVGPSQGERLASPLLLRAVYAGDDKDGNAQWHPSALLTPYQHILDMQVEVNGHQYPIWKEDTAEHTRPISENGGQDPMQAFLTYFAK